MTRPDAVSVTQPKHSAQRETCARHRPHPGVSRPGKGRRGHPWRPPDAFVQRRFAALPAHVAWPQSRDLTRAGGRRNLLFIRL